MSLYLITGSAKGIGRALVERLSRANPSSTILMTTRNNESGEKTLGELSSKGYSNVKFHQLDINDSDSRSKIMQHIKSTYGGLDVLLNNAGIYVKPSQKLSFPDEVDITLKTNYLSPMALAQECLPILKENSRIVNVGAKIGILGYNKISKENYERIMNCKSIQELNEIAYEYKKYAEEKSLVKNGWINLVYAISKSFINRGSEILAQSVADDHRKIIVTACCPGSVKTDMTGNKGLLTPEEGAETPAWLADNKDPSINGKFFVIKTPLDMKRNPNIKFG